MTKGKAENCVNENSSPEYKCDDCDYMGLTTESVKMHFNIVHNNQIMYPCEGCPVIFKSLSNLRRHITHTKHKVRESILISCKKCEFTTSSKDTLKKHSRIHKIKFVD